MGLKRVFAAITPLMAIIALFGFDLFNKIIVDSSRKGLMAISLLLIFVFPFTSNPAAVDWNDLNLTDAQENARSVAAYLKEKGEVNNRFIYTDPYLSYALKVDPFDGEKHQILAQNEGIVSPTLKSGDLIIWDNWHSVVDYGVSPDMLSNLEFIEGFSQEKSIYKIYRKE